MLLTISNGRIKSVLFNAKGCLNIIVCVNIIIFIAEGKTIAEAWKIITKDVVDYLAILSSKEIYCAELTVGSLYRVLSD